jgi:hypothetical protein
MHGEKAIALLREAKRNAPDLPPFDVMLYDVLASCFLK